MAARSSGMGLSKGHGAGGMHSKLGMRKATAENLALVLTTGSMGQLLYNKLGFERLGVVHCQVDEDEDYLELLAMVYNS